MHSLNKLKDSTIKSEIFEGIDKISQVAQNLIHEPTKILVRH